MIDPPYMLSPIKIRENSQAVRVIGLLIASKEILCQPWYQRWVKVYAASPPSSCSRGGSSSGSSSSSSSGSGSSSSSSSSSGDTAGAKKRRRNNIIEKKPKNELLYCVPCSAWSQKQVPGTRLDHIGTHSASPAIGQNNTLLYLMWFCQRIPRVPLVLLCYQ